MQETQKPTLLVALGGNALIRKGEQGTTQQQFRNLAVPIRQIAKLSQEYRIIITHGNGPQVGKLLLANAVARERVAPQSLDVLVAQTQGALAYLLSQAFENALR